MKIGLIYADALCAGGYPRDIRALASALSCNGANVTLYTRRRGSCYAPPTGVRSVSLETLKHTSEDIYHIFGVFLPEQLLAVRRILERRPVVLSPVGHLMPHHLRRALVRKALYLKLLKSFFRKISCFHVFSSTEAVSVRQYLGCHVRMFEANLGIFAVPAYAGGLREEERRRASEEAKFLFFGRNDIHQKGIDVLLHGFDLAVRSGARARLVIAGKPWGKSRRFIGRFVQEKGLSEVVDVLGPVDEGVKWKLLADADYLVFLSRWDGPPRPIREAIAVGTPVVVSPETNMGDLVAGFNAGDVVDLDPVWVGDRILRLSADKSQRFEHRKGVERLRTRLAWHRVAGDYFCGYEAVLKSWR